MKTPLILGLIILSTLTLASCTHTTPIPVTPTQTVPKTEATPTPSMNHGTSDTKIEEEHHMGASSEEEFIVNMIPHHQEAVDTAKIIVAKTENAELKKIAQGIVDGQSKEIIILGGWLKNWYPNSALKTEWAPMMRDLSKLSAHDLDDAFMEDMIKHHEGAVHMAEEVLDVTQRPEIVKMTKDIILAQNAEIATFKKMLADH
jgi:uncharacterized protein (DUF305 family)